VGNAARKLRKRNGEPLDRKPKEPTPLIERRSFIAASPDKQRALAEAHGIELTIRAQMALAVQRFQWTGKR
jgi:hypothetical protein